MKRTDVIAKKNIEKVLIAKSYPTCFNSQQEYSEWKDAELLAPTQAFRGNFCEDCNNCFKTQMVLARRCINTHLVLKD